MADRLVKMDYERGKVVVMRTTIDSNGDPVEEQVELYLPETQLPRGPIRKVKHGKDGRLHENEEATETSVLTNNEKAEELQKNKHK